MDDSGVLAGAVEHLALRGVAPERRLAEHVRAGLGRVDRRLHVQRRRRGVHEQLDAAVAEDVAPVVRRLRVGARRGAGGGVRVGVDHELEARRQREVPLLHEPERRDPRGALHPRAEKCRAELSHRA